MPPLPLGAVARPAVACLQVPRGGRSLRSLRLGGGGRSRSCAPLAASGSSGASACGPGGRGGGGTR